MDRITYTIRPSVRAKRIRITVYHDGRVTVIKPAHLSDSYIGPFVQKHAEWIRKKVDRFQSKPLPLLARYSKREYKQYKENAKALVLERVNYFNQFYNFSFGTVRIGNQRTRWGSCSSKKNLNFNYKIVFLPKELQDYLIVHELSHLKELNHSKRFWDTVGEQVPDHVIRRKRLKQY